MNTIPLTQTTPLYADRDGVLRLAGSRVLLDLVVYEFNQGATAEQIIEEPVTLLHCSLPDEFPGRVIHLPL